MIRALLPSRVYEAYLWHTKPEGGWGAGVTPPYIVPLDAVVLQVAVGLRSGKAP